MTAEEYILENMFGTDLSDIELIVQGYAKIKCSELLEICAEKASKMEATIYTSATAPRYARLDKNSILNAVNLEEFIRC